MLNLDIELQSVADVVAVVAQSGEAIDPAQQVILLKHLLGAASVLCSHIDYLVDGDDCLIAKIEDAVDDALDHFDRLACLTVIPG